MTFLMGVTDKYSSLDILHISRCVRGAICSRRSEQFQISYRRGKLGGLFISELRIVTQK